MFFLVYGYPILLASAFAVLIALLALNARGLSVACRTRLSSRGWAAIIVLFIVALILRIWFSPYAHQVYFDEFDHLDVAGNLARGGILARTLVGGRADVSVLAPTLWPGGWHLLLALALRLTGFAAGTAFALNILLGALSVPLLAIAGAVLWRNEKAGIIGAALLCLHPVHLQYSGAGDTTTTSIFALALVLMCAAFHRERHDARSYWLLLAALSCAAHVRLENMLLLPLVVAFPRGARARLTAGSLFMLSLLPLAVLVWSNRSTAVPGFADSLGAMLTHLARNAPGNLLYLLDPRAGLLIVAPAVCAFVWGTPQRREARILTMLAAAYFILYSAYHLGRFPESSQSRYALSVFALLMPVAGLGLTVLPARGRAVVLTLFGLGYAYSARANYTAQSSPLLAREEAFLRGAASLLPDSTFVITSSPAAVLASSHRPVVSAHWCLAQPEACKTLRGQSPELILLKDYLWYLREGELAPLEEQLRREYSFEVLSEIELNRKQYAFYRLTRRSAAGTRR